MVRALRGLASDGSKAFNAKEALAQRLVHHWAHPSTIAALDETPLRLVHKRTVQRGINAHSMRTPIDCHPARFGNVLQAVGEVNKI